MTQQKYKVSEKAPSGLFLRSEPLVKESTKILVIPMGQEVIKLNESNVANWWNVSVNIQDSSFTGYVNSKFLTKSESFVEPATSNGIIKVHLTSNNSVTRRNKSWAFSLNENSQPTRRTGDSTDDQAKSLTDIVSWLNVENTGHLRYKPTASSTYCNIYAYDYCYLAGVYLPRVWWTSKALIDLSAGRTLQPVYAKTVHEINANSLFIWLKDFGPSFGWRRTASINEMQTAANNGKVTIICAQNKTPNKSGHICPVVPETNSNQAERKNGVVVKPLQSQAGRVNRKYQTDLWWNRLASTFREHGFWINET